MSSLVSVSDARACLPTDRATLVRFELLAVAGVAGASPSSKSAVECRVLRRDVPLCPRLVDATDDGVAGGGMDSMSFASLAIDVDRLLMSVIPALVRRTRSRSRSIFRA